MSIVYEFPVYYNLSIQELLEMGGFEKVDSRINDKNFPRDKNIPKGEEMIKGRLYFFPHQRYREANIYELLSFGIKFPEIQKNHIIFALGSFIMNKYKERLMPALFIEAGGRAAILEQLTFGDIIGFEKFLFIR
jgi:hypothetical protein